MTTDIIVVEVKQESVQEVFTSNDKLQPILDEISKKAKSIVPDTSTAKGRKEIASIAYQVARTKTYLDGLGKNLVADMKKLPGLVDASRKQARDYLDQLAEEVRKPLTEWEAEQERIAAEKKAKEEAEALAKQIEADHEIGLLMNREFDREKADRIAAEQQAQREREAQIARDAEAEAQRKAEQAIRNAQEAERLAKESAEIAARNLQLAQERAELERKASAEREEKARKDAVEAEQRRAAIIRAAEEKAQRDREADTAHKASINRAAMADLIEAGLNEEQAKRVVCAIAKGLIKNVQIHY